MGLLTVLCVAHSEAGSLGLLLTMAHTFGQGVASAAAEVRSLALS